MNILFFTTDPRGATGGTSDVLRKLSSYCNDEGLKVSNMHLAYHENKVSENGIDKYDVPLSTPRTRFKLPKPSFLLGFAVSIIRLFYLLRQIRPDVINIHYIDAHSLYFFLLRPFFGYRIVLSAHGSDLLRPASRVDQVLLPYLLRNADGITTVSNVLGDKVGEFISPYSHPVRVIPNGIDLSLWGNDKSQNEISSTDNIHIVHVGRLDHVKGQDVLVQAFARFSNAHPEAQLTLVGVGPLRPDLEKLVTEHNLGDKVHFPGEVPSKNVKDILLDASLFAFPSRSEGLGIALIEAMACGLPIVASDVGGIPELITDNKTGLLVPSGDAEALCNAISYLVDSPRIAQELANNAREEGHKYSLEQVLIEYNSVYNRVL